MEVTLTTELQDKAKEIVALREKQAGYFEAIKSAQTTDEKSRLKEQAQAGIKEIEAKSLEYEDAVSLLQQEQANREALKSMSQVQRKYGFSGEGNAALENRTPELDTRSLGQIFVESDAYKNFVQSGGYKSAPVNIDMDGVSVKSLYDGTSGGGYSNAEIKAAMLTTNTWAPYGPRLPGYIPSAVRIPTFADLIPQRDSDSPIFYYMEETTGPTGTSAAYTAEGATKPEVSFALTSRTVEAAKIAVTMNPSEEQLEDIPQIREYLDNRGTMELQLAEEDALLDFTAGANKWDGFLQKSTVQSHAKGSDPTPTAILKAMVKVQYSPGFAGISTGLAMNPVDWQNVLTLQESTGAYIWSAPSAPTEMPDMRMWGMTVRPVVALDQGTALTGNFRMFSQIWRRQGINSRVAYANDDVLKNLVRIIIEERLALVISRGAAFCKVTGLPA